MLATRGMHSVSVCVSVSLCLWTSPDATVETSQVCMDVDVDVVDAAVFPWTKVDSGLSVQGGILYAPLPACIALQEFFLSFFLLTFF